MAVELLSTALPRPARPHHPYTHRLNNGREIVSVLREFLGESSPHPPPETQDSHPRLCMHTGKRTVTEAYVSEQGQCCLAHTPLATE